MPRLKACQSHATVERAPEAPQLPEVGSSVGSLRNSVGCAGRSAQLDVISIAEAGDKTARRRHTHRLRPVRQAREPRATVQRAGEAPRIPEVGSGIGSLQKSVGCTRRTAPLDVTPIASTSDPTARRGSTRILRHVRKSTRSSALLYYEPVKRRIAPKLAAASAVSGNLPAAHGERRRSMLLQSPV